MKKKLIGLAGACLIMLATEIKPNEKLATRAQILIQEIQNDPNNLTALYELGFVCTRLNDLDTAVTCYKKILEHMPDHADTCYNLAYALRLQAKDKEAITYYEKSLELNPSNDQAHLGLAKAYLRCGNFKRGLEEFEWRWQDSKKYIEEFGHHAITPEMLKGKRVFLRAEWGLGDTIQFIRYAKLLHDCGAIVIAQTFNPLVNLLSRATYINQVVKIDEMPCYFDYQIPLLSLPFIFKTELATIPAPIPYLQADPTLVTYWQKQLSSDTKFKIGICWQGNAQCFLDDHPMTRRSIPLDLFAQLGNLSNVSLYSLQQINGVEQLQEISNTITIHVFDENFDVEHGRYMDTAAVIENLDLIISIDTSVIHVAGALGKPVWVLLPYTSEWRWLIDRTDTPWYPTMKLFRQPTPGDWTSVIQNICEELQKITR